MTVQLDDLTRNNILEAVELAQRGQTLLNGTITGTAGQPSLVILTGSMPAKNAADTGTALVNMTLPADCYANSSAGTKGIAGTWQATASAAGTAGYYRIKDPTGAVREQGSITATGGGGDLTLDNVTIAVGQTVTITSKTYTAPNA